MNDNLPPQLTVLKRPVLEFFSEKRFFIYFLTDRVGRVFYVGVSNNVDSRIKAQIKDKRPHRVHFILVDEGDDAYRVERALILYFRPIKNRPPGQTGEYLPDPDVIAKYVDGTLSRQLPVFGMRLGEKRSINE